MSNATRDVESDVIGVANQIKQNSNSIAINCNIKFICCEIIRTVIFRVILMFSCLYQRLAGMNLVLSETTLTIVMKFGLGISKIIM